MNRDNPAPARVSGAHSGFAGTVWACERVRYVQRGESGLATMARGRRGADCDCRGRSSAIQSMLGYNIGVKTCVC